ncbi:MAG: hypothetical protein ACSHYA_00500 [Opitutaceae bacterium]
MNSFSKQRHLSCLLSGKSLFFALLTLIASVSSLLSQSGDELFRGTWYIETPDDEALILIVKRNGLASYFWGDNTDRTVYQGNWTGTDETATLKWSDGTKHEIKRDALGFGISHIQANGQLSYTVPAQQVPPEILGQWAKPPSKNAQITSAQDKAKGFFGIWQIGEASANHFLHIESDRSAASSQNTELGLRGSWAKQGSELHIAWDNGAYSILRENERSHDYKTVESGTFIEEDTTDFTKAERTIEGKVPATWLSNYKEERATSTGGIAFTSRKNARTFYRGTWLVRINEDAYERVELGRFGGLTTSSNHKVEGSWRMDRQDIFMRLDNGQRRILSPVGNGFIIYEYKPGRPLDGVPTRILTATPADASKFEQHLKGRKDVSRQMLALAEAAGISPSEQNAGWGRTFARWAWPFGETSPNTSANELLKEAYEEKSEANPWWWPFWNESSLDESNKPASTLAEAPIPAETESLKVTKAVEAPEKSDKTEEKKNWAWPF